MQFSKSTQSPTAWQRAKLAISSGAALMGYAFGAVYAAGTAGAHMQKTPRTVNTLAALKALDSTENPWAFLAGRLTPNDGGDGMYWLDTTDTVTVGDDALVVTPTDNGGRWKLIYKDSVNVELFGAKGDGATNDRTAIQNALNSGAKIVRLQHSKNYKINTGVTIPAGVELSGDGMANATLTCGADITPITFNSNDACVRNLLIVAHATQTAPIISLDANGVTIARNRIRDIQVSGSGTDFPFISAVSRGGAYGNWAHTIERVSVSGCGTIFKAETQSANSWINSISMRHVHANDFVRGMHLIQTLGDGCSDSTFFDWTTQTSARTEFGLLIADVSAQGISRKNCLTDVRFYDQPAACIGWYIGANVVDTCINGLAVDDITPARIRDTGVNTRINGMWVPEYMTRLGRVVQMVTNAGMTAATTGTGTTQSLVPYAVLQTGATLGSLARLYTTETLSGLGAGQSIFNIDFGKTVRASFVLSRITAGASGIGRWQVTTVQTDGVLVGKGFGLQINNYDLYGESYGSAQATVNLGVTMADAQAYRIDIVCYPGVRVEWWVDGVLKGVQTTVANLPNTVVACYLHTSLSNVAANDMQMLFTPATIAAAA